MKRQIRLFFHNQPLLTPPRYMEHFRIGPHVGRCLLSTRWITIMNEIILEEV